MRLLKDLDHLLHKSFRPDQLPHHQNVPSHNTNSCPFVQYSLVHWNHSTTMAGGGNQITTKEH